MYAAMHRKIKQLAIDWARGPIITLTRLKASEYQAFFPLVLKRSFTNKSSEDMTLTNKNPTVWKY